MTQLWEPGTQYNLNDVVEYEGHRYKIIQPHRSQGDWTPPVTPALWGRLQDGAHGHQQPSGQQQPYQAPPQYQDGQHSNNQAQQQPAKPAEPAKEHEHWYEDKKKLGVAGGLLAGAGLLAGGVAAYKHHEHKKSREEYLEDAKARAALYNSKGPSGPATWVLTSGKVIPAGAIEIGKEHSWTIYIARAHHKESLTPGKCSDAFKKGAVIGYGHDEIHFDTYEVLVGDMRALEWIQVNGKLNINALGRRPVEGGYDSDETPLFIAKAFHKDAWHPGKCSEKLDAAFIPYGDDEVEAKSYQVLCYRQ